MQAQGSRTTQSTTIAERTCERGRWAPGKLWQMGTNGSPAWPPEEVSPRNIKAHGECLFLRTPIHLSVPQNILLPFLTFDPFQQCFPAAYHSSILTIFTSLATVMVATLTDSISWIRQTLLVQARGTWVRVSWVTLTVIQNTLTLLSAKSMGRIPTRVSRVVHLGGRRSETHFQSQDMPPNSTRA